MSTGPLSFEKDIRPLFRERDRSAMQWRFDLWSYEDVRDEADAILDTVSAGNMPCDGAWPQEQIDRFKEWISQGKGA